jgi:DNA polymerase III subunit epsilon
LRAFSAVRVVEISDGAPRILKMLEPRPVVATARHGFPLKGVILDTETTGFNQRKDEIIEIGTIAFTFDEAGNIGDVIGVYGGLQRPSISIPPETTRLSASQ